MYFFYGDLWVKFYKSIGEIWICCRRLYKKFTGEPQNTEKFDKFISDF